MIDTKNTTSFIEIYDSFLARVTDDMYLELTELDTIEMLQDILINAIPRFEFPRFDIFDYETGDFDDMGFYCGVESDYQELPLIGWIGGYFNSKLTQEEINIISLNMLIEWFIQQLAVTDLAKMKYSGQDFKMSSQANHMAKLKVMVDANKQDSLHLQRIYKRRRFGKSGAQSTMNEIMSSSVGD